MKHWTPMMCRIVIAILSVAMLDVGSVRAASSPPDYDGPMFLKGDDTPRQKKKHKRRHSGRRHSRKSEHEKKIRWGQRHHESDAKYDKRFARMMKRTKLDPKDDIDGGVITDGKKRIRLWTYKGRLFIVRTDIDKEFTVNTAMYMEMLHREYGKAYHKLLGVPVKMHEKVEVMVFADRATYMRNHGAPGSGGFFQPIANLAYQDRSPQWPAQRFRLEQFTSGIRKFEKWDKGTLKHEASHMELQMRLGYALLPNIKYTFPVIAPRWFNEGHATVFEYWNFDKSVDENFAAIPNRGRYAPYIRRIHGTKLWRDFDYVWTIDGQTWANDMTSQQGYLNYAQAWSLCGYMMGGGTAGKMDFRAVFDLTKRVGMNEENRKGVGKRAWELNFPPNRQRELEENWNKWVTENVSRDKRVPDEEFYMRAQGYDPSVVRKLKHFETEEEQKANAEWMKKELERRKKSDKIEK